MSETPMTLIERLRNPQWSKEGPPVLDTDCTLKTMQEAAYRLENIQAEKQAGIA